MKLMTPPVVDLRSDTVTQPTPAMLQAMVQAPLGDDVFDDDPSVHALQNKAATLLGKEAALFFPTGTQSNLCAILSHCQRGDEYIVGQQAHTYRYEGGGAAVLGSVQPQPLIQDEEGQMDMEAIAAAIKPDDPHFAMTRLLCLENTWSGKVMPMDYLSACAVLARKRGLALHLDGARLCNAAVFQAQIKNSTPEAEIRSIASLFDSISLCFSKGLGAPIGSVLCASAALIAKARRLRKITGGGMRQTGLLAAAASYALDHHLHRLQTDHDLAQTLAKGLLQIEGMQVLSAATNIVFARVKEGASGCNTQGLLEYLRTHGILATGVMGLRFVTHMGVNAEGIARTLQATENYFTHQH